MLKVFLGLCFLFSGVVCFPNTTRAQGSQTGSGEPAHTISLSADSWSFQPGTVEFLPAAPSIGGVTPTGPAMKIIGGGDGRCKKY